MQSEFEFIHNIKKKYNLDRIGDDCAVLPKDASTDLVITADMLVEDIDFRLAWTTAGSLGHKALAVSLSDIAAMGARPVWAMLSLAVPDALWGERFLDEFYKGWMHLAGRYGVELIGGDVSRSPDKLVIDSTVAGEVDKGTAILRSGAKPGDSVYVTGSLGGAAGGLKILESADSLSHDAASAALISRQRRPEPSIAIGLALMAAGSVSAMIDISDGLSSDLGHICRMSGVGARIFADRIPIDINLEKLPADQNEKLELALNGGEDFELLFTSADQELSASIEAPITLIGEVTARVDIIELIDGADRSILTPKGYRHF